MQYWWCFFFLSFTTFSQVLSAQNALSSHPPLRCCFMDEPPISFQNPLTFTNNGLDGVIANFLLQHQAHLNWTCSSMKRFQQRTNSSGFNEFVTTMNECTNRASGQLIDSPECVCDIGIGGWFQNTDRFGKVDYLPPFAFDSYRVLTHVSSATASGKLSFFLSAFDIPAWAAIAALSTMFIFLKMLDARFAVASPFFPLSGKHTRYERYSHYLKKSRLFYRLRKAFQSTVMRMLLMSDETVVQSQSSTRQWFLNLGLAMCALFLILAYEASMTASLVQESFTSKFESAMDFRTCRIPPSHVCLISGGALQSFWKTSIAIEKCHDHEEPNYYATYEELFEAVEDGRCQFGLALESSVTAAIRERYCGRFVILGEPFATGGLSMLLPRGSNLTEPMSQTTLGLQRNQTMTSLSKYFLSKPQCSTEVITTLTFDKLRLFFLLAFCFGLVIFLEMVLDPQRAFRDAVGRREVARPQADLVSNKLRCDTFGSFSSLEVGGDDFSV